MIYLDHAATSWPKPPEVLQAMQHYLEAAGGNPGRSGHRLSIDAGRIVYDTREAIAHLFNAPDPLRVIFAPNATYALNQALYGLLLPGDRVVTTGIEHNSVMRPLRDLERRGMHLTVVPCAPDGTLELELLAQALQGGPRLLVLNHASNVTGTLTPVAEATALAHRAGALVLLDASQTAGVLPIDLPALGIDLLAFTGHKGLYGPPGTGGLVLAAGFDPNWLNPILRGGTGSRSEYEEQPEMLPDKFESGTPNGVGIAGLGAGVRWILAQGIEAIRAHEMSLTSQLLAGLAEISQVRVYGPHNPDKQTATVSFTIQGHYVSEIGLRLDEEYDILCRVGLHCSPAAHRTIGTFPEGTVRLSLGLSNTTADVGIVLQAIKKLSRP
ncbi:MAG: aminotransferase class V-fold PLP-dependent enzyme [Anaerolineae bacterium]